MKKWIARISLAVLAILLIGGATWGTREWIRYPKKPDISKVKVEDAIAFIGTDDFNRLYERDRKRYAMAAANRLREKSFAELVDMMVNPANSTDDRRRIAENLRKLPGNEEVTSVMMSIFLDKFYQQNETQRNVHLMMMVKLGQSAGNRPEAARRMREQGLPSLERFQKDFAKFLEKQPPRVQAQVAQFMMDLRRQREIMGVAEPF